MTKKIIIFVALLLVFATIFVACNNPAGNDEETTGPEGTSAQTGETTTGTDAATTDTQKPSDDDDEEESGPYTVTETLMSESLREEVYEEFESNARLSYVFPGYLNFGISTSVMGNVTVMNDCRLLSVTIPVWKTGSTDSDGNFVFTISVFDSSFAGLKQAAKRTYKIKINAEQHGLLANKNTVRKAIKVDLTSYNIALGENEAVGFYAQGDTLSMAMLKNNTGWNTKDNSHTVYQMLREKAPYMTGTYNNAGTAELAYSHDTLMLDFEWEKTYESKAEYLAMHDTSEYDSMVEELKSKYSGKYVSVIGDSISTFRGVSNDGTANSDIANNEPYYPDFSGNVSDYTLTYWGKIIKELDMKPCVINTWSGSMAYGKDDGVGKNMLVRAGELHRDNGTPSNKSDDIAPDVILVYLGINDLSGGRLYDAELSGIIAGGYTKSEIGTWFNGVLAQANRAGSEVIPGTTYKNFSQVYALSLNKMKELYPNAEIYCLTYQETNHPSISTERFNEFNNAVKALADYFGATVVDQSLDSITKDNCHAFAGDMTSLHPTATGHAIMAENIMKNMYAKSKE